MNMAPPLFLQDCASPLPLRSGIKRDLKSMHYGLVGINDRLNQDCGALSLK